MNKIKKDFYTKTEIEGQPRLWIDTLKSISTNEKIAEFLGPLHEKKELNIVLTGAGTSAYIGETTEHLFRNGKGISARAISTTTLVTHFDSYVDTSVPLLLISFARSGNSPESIATVDIAESKCDEVYHVALTCNEEGQLARKVSGLSNGLAILLPPESEDKGLAMTGSFTSMVLSSIFLAHHYNGGNHTKDLDMVAASADEEINNCAAELKVLSFKDFDRIVFLGSGPLEGIAKESHLKVQELTDGHVVGKFDSFLGFRHGPKAVVNEQTVLVFLFSPDPQVFQYEKDLVEEILEDGIAKYCLGVFCDAEQAQELDLDQKIIFDLEGDVRYSDYNLLLYVLPAQIIGFYKSLYLGLNPDSPSQNNVISRVVKGVTIYK
jgi:tagatose-6-phosphate ketose/aldose isomerase